MRIPVDPSMTLAFRAWNSLAANNLTLTAMMRMKNGALTILSSQLTPTVDRVLSLASMPLHDGEIVSLSVSSANAALQRGQCFVQVELLKGAGATATGLQVLIQNYVTAAENAGYPHGKITSSLEGQGYRSFSTAPTILAPGYQVFEVPAGALWKPKILHGQLITDATVVSRFPFLMVDDGADDRLFGPGFNAVTASESVECSWFPESGDRLGVNWIAALTDASLPAGNRIGLNTTNFQAGDDWSSVELYFEEFILI